MGAMRRVFCGAAIFVAILTDGSGAAEGLPAGAERDTVEAICTGCHGTNVIERSTGYTHEQWSDLIAAMVDLSG
jgi:virginiamycin B lyase